MSKGFKEILSALSKHLVKSKDEIYPTSNPNENFDESSFSNSKTKTVYRFCSENELNCLENNNKDGLGNYFVSFPKQPNTHKYKKDEKYLHFFDNKDDAKSSLPDLPGEKSFLCSFQIASSVLKECKGFGYYSPRGYDEDYIKVKEYAIPVSQFDINSFCDSVSIVALYKKQEPADNIFKSDDVSYQSIDNTPLDKYEPPQQ